MRALKFLNNIIEKFFGKEEKKTKVYEFEESKEPERFVSVWDYLLFRENTQASHLSKVIGFEEWVPMKEILRRIKELFGVEYLNEKSLYPYLKTLTDINLFETSDVGGQRKWRKKEIIIKITEKKERLTEDVATPKEAEKIIV